MRPIVRIAVAAFVLAAAAPAFAQDWYEPNPSLASLSSDDAYARTSAQSLRTAGIETAYGIRLDDAGRVLVGGGVAYAGWPYLDGELYPAQPVVARLLADGSLDPSFGDGGAARVPVHCNSLALDVDAAGRIVIVGRFASPDAQDYSGPWYAAARLTADGALDASYSGDGLANSSSGGGQWLTAVHAAGADGSMIAADTTPAFRWGNTSRRGQGGLVRISGDGVIDTTYFGVYALGKGWVQDFAVDAAGRAVVAFVDGYSLSPDVGAVVRLAADGTLDASFGTGGRSVYSVNPLVTLVNGWTSRVKLDGAGRIVLFFTGGLQRRLDDGSLDPTFSGDGVATHTAERFEVGAGGYGDVLAVATAADRYVLAGQIGYRSKRRPDLRGIGVESMDPTNLGAIASSAVPAPGAPSADALGVAVTPDGTTAFTLAQTPSPVVLRTDLASPAPRPLPDLRVRWIGNVRAVDLGGGRSRISARVRIRNVARREAEAVMVRFGFGDGTFDVPLVPPMPFVSPNTPYAGYWRPFRVRGRSSVVRRFRWEGEAPSTGLAGARLGIQVSCELPDANFADNTATSLPITPVYAPR